MQILIVDDSNESRLLFQSILQRAGLGAIVTEETAEAALARLQNEKPLQTDLVLMDLSLPGMSGLDAIGAIRANEHTREVPIIVFTAHSEVVHLEAAFEAGATDFVSKSANNTELLHRIRAALRLKHEVDRRKARERRPRRSGVPSAWPKRFSWGSRSCACPIRVSRAVNLSR